MLIFNVTEKYETGGKFKHPNNLERNKRRREMNTAKMMVLFFAFCISTFYINNINAQTTAAPSATTATTAPTAPTAPTATTATITPTAMMATNEWTEWNLLNAEISGDRVVWKDEWTTSMQQAKDTLNNTPLACLEVQGYEDVIGYGQTKQEQLEIRVAGGEEPLRMQRARTRMIFVMSKLQEVGVKAYQIREGLPVINAPEGQRGAVVNLIPECFPKPPVAISCWDTNGNNTNDTYEDMNEDGKWDALDCIGDDGKGEVNITYDLLGQFLFTADRPFFYGVLFRANFPVFTEGWTVGVGALFGNTEYAGAGFELMLEYDWSQWVKPRYGLVARGYELDEHLYFGRGEFGFALGVVGEVYKHESFSIVYELRGELKGDVEDSRGWDFVESGAAHLGVRF